MSYKEFGLTSRESSANREAPNRHIKGSKKYKEMIHKANKEADQKNLPFTFSKPQKPQSLAVTCWCPDCGYESASRVSKSTIMVVCTKCKKLYSLTDENSSR